MGFVRRTDSPPDIAVGRRSRLCGRQSRPRKPGRQYEDQPTQEQVPPAPPPPAPTTGTSDVEQLEQLAQLHDAGALTDDEFAAEKAKILGA